MAFFTLKIALLFCLSHSAWAARDLRVCDVITENCGLIPPPLPKNFEMTNGKVASKSLKYEEYYFDYTNLKAKYVQIFEGLERNYIFDYENEQIIKYYQLHPGAEMKKDPMSDTCKVEKMETSRLRNLFGYKDGQFLTKHSRMFDSGEVLRFGGRYRYAYNGTTNLEERGMSGNAFRGCIYDPYLDSTAEMYQIFSNEHVTPSGGLDNGFDDDFVQNAEYLPLPLEIRYHGLNGSSNVPIDTVMNVAWFKEEPDFDYDTFKIPPYLYCDGYRGSKPMPKFPRAFSARVEMSVYTQDEHGEMLASEIVSYDQLFYNYAKKLARRDFTPVPERDSDIISKFGNKGPVKVIFDYNVGVAHVINKNSGRCYTRQINIGDYFEKMGESMLLMMAEPEELFRVNADEQEYKGKYFARDIETDVWAGKHYDEVLKENFYTETHFTTDGWHEETNDLSEYGVPVRQTVLTNREMDGDFVQSVSETNFFKFKIAEPPLMVFEVQNCVEHLEHRFLVITLSIAPKDLDYIIANKWYFHEAMQYYIATVSDIGSPLRVQRVQLQNAKNQYFLVFAFVGNALQRPGVTINQAVSNLYGFIDRQKFELKFRVPGSSEEKRVTGKGLFELPEEEDKSAPVKSAEHIRLKDFSSYLSQDFSSYQQIRKKSYAYLRADTKKTEAKKGMNAGGLAGLAIGMLIVGAGIGIGVMCLYIKRYDNPGQTLFNMKG